MIVSHLLLILHKKYSFISLCLKPEMCQKVAKFKGAEYFRKALYMILYYLNYLNYLVPLHSDSELVLFVYSLVIVFIVLK